VDRRRRHPHLELGGAVVGRSRDAPRSPASSHCRSRVSASCGNHSQTSLRQSVSAVGGPPGQIPAASAGARYFRSVLRSTPRLVASSFFDRPAYQWIKISTMSITSKVLLANSWSPRCLPTGRHRRLTRTKTHHDTHVVPMGNYVIANPSNLGNFMIADRRGLVPQAEPRVLLVTR